MWPTPPSPGKYKFLQRWELIYLSLFPKLCPFRRVLSFLQQQFHRLWSFAPFPSIRCDFAKNKFENCGRNKKLQGWVEGWIKLFWPKHLPFLRRNIYHLKLGLRKPILLQKTNNNAVYGTQWVNHRCRSKLIWMGTMSSKNDKNSIFGLYWEYMSESLKRCHQLRNQSQKDGTLWKIPLYSAFAWAHKPILYGAFGEGMSAAYTRPKIQSTNRKKLLRVNHCSDVTRCEANRKKK